MLIHEFTAWKVKDQIAGVVLVDAKHETAPLVMDIDDPIFWTVVAAGVESYSTWGVEAEHKFTQDERNAFRAAAATTEM